MKGEVTRAKGHRALASLVASRLAQNGVVAVLTGGSVVTIYSRNAYLSGDLDFVTYGPDQGIRIAMKSLGFVRDPGGHWTHPDTDLFLEFLPPPLAIGRRPVTRWARLKTPQGRLTLLDPTQCVMDRLAAWYHWKDPQSLEQALAVSKRRQIRLSEVENWSVEEGMTDQFAVFKTRLGMPGKLGKRKPR